MLRGRSFLSALLAGALVLAGPGLASAHLERETEFPDGTGSVPQYRPLVSKPNLVVCKDDSSARIRKIGDKALRRTNQKLLAACEFEHIQEAVNSVTRRGSTIYVLPGVYEEGPTRPIPACEANLGPRPRTYVEQLTCPHAENLIGVIGDLNPDDDKRECNAPVCDLQIEGTGEDAEDVVITGGFDKDGNWAKLNGIRGDRSDGLYLKNFTVELFEFNAVYILETDGIALDDVVVRNNDEYGFLTYAVDHGIHVNCEAYGNGEAGVYPGSASDVNNGSPDTGPLKRVAVEIADCSFHDNTLGMAGTAGNSLYLHDNKFFNNSAGVTVDSFFPNHPGLPQNHGWFENNLIYSNNENYYEKYMYTGVCDKPPAERGYENGAICPIVPAPVGTGVLVAGGHHNYVHNNLIYDNWRAGIMMFGVPAALREDYDPAAQFDTSNFNFFVDNILGLMPSGAKAPNGLDVWWDDQGEGNCWSKNRSGSEEVTSNTLYPGGLPDCESGGSAPIPINLVKQGPLIPCAVYDREDPILRQPPGCTWMTTPEKP